MSVGLALQGDVVEEYVLSVVRDAFPIRYTLSSELSRFHYQRTTCAEDLETRIFFVFSHNRVEFEGRLICVRIEPESERSLPSNIHDERVWRGAGHGFR